MLEWLGDGGLGALRFSSHEKEPRQSEIAHWTDLGRLQQAAMAMESQEVDLATISQNFRDAGTPSGGARPKVLLPNYLVKFPSGKDGFHVLESEHTVMQLAAKTGLRTAKTQLHENHGSNLLAVERFDCLPTGGRAHMISMVSVARIGFFMATQNQLTLAGLLALRVHFVSLSSEYHCRTGG